MKRRDITLGEMQDECLRIKGHCTECAPDIHAMCDGMIGKRCNNSVCPIGWNLTDPPRFTEAQMAFWRCLYEVGVKYVFRAIKWICLSDDENPEYAPVANLGTINISAVHDCMKLGETLDLAELLGKGAT